MKLAVRTPLTSCISIMAAEGGFPAFTAGKVSGSIPPISTRRIMKGLISSEIKPFCSPKNEYWDDAGSFHRRSSVIPPIEKAVSTNQEIVKAAFYVVPKMCLTVRHISNFSLFYHPIENALAYGRSLFERLSGDPKTGFFIASDSTHIPGSHFQIQRLFREQRLPLFPLPQD